MTMKSERGYQLTGKFVVYRYLDGICAGKVAAFDSLSEAYNFAKDHHRRDSRPHLEFRIRGVGLPSDVIARLNLPFPVPGPTATVWYVLDSSSAKLPAIPAGQVLRAIEATISQTVQPNPSEGKLHSAAEAVTVQADPQCSTERRIEGWEQLQPVWKRHFTYDGRLLHHRLRRGSRSLSPLSPSEQGVQNALLRRDPTFYWVSA